METLHQTAAQLRRRKFEACVFENSAAAVADICARITGKAVGLGGSISVKEIGLGDEMPKHAAQVFGHEPGGAGADERNSLTADIFIASVNGLSQDGQVVNIDGTGNRIAATCFGPKELFWVVGKNKIVPTLEDALARAKQTAVRLAAFYGRNTPCGKTGKCEECLSLECVCSVTTIHRKRPTGLKVTVYLINEELGM